MSVHPEEKKQEEKEIEGSEAGEKKPEVEGSEAGEKKPEVEGSEAGEKKPEVEGSEGGEEQPAVEGSEAGEKKPEVEGSEAGEEKPEVEGSEAGEKKHGVDKDEEGRNKTYVLVDLYEKYYERKKSLDAKIEQVPQMLRQDTALVKFAEVNQVISRLDELVRDKMLASSKGVFCEFNENPLVQHWVDISAMLARMDVAKPLLQSAMSAKDSALVRGCHDFWSMCRGHSTRSTELARKLQLDGVHAVFVSVAHLSNLVYTVFKVYKHVWALESAPGDDAWWKAVEAAAVEHDAMSKEYVVVEKALTHSLPSDEAALLSLVNKLAAVDKDLHTSVRKVVQSIRSCMSVTLNVRGHLSRYLVGTVGARLKQDYNSVKDCMATDYMKFAVEQYNAAKVKSEILDKKEAFRLLMQRKDSLLAHYVKVNSTSLRDAELSQECKNVWQEAHNYVGMCSVLNMVQKKNIKKEDLPDTIAAKKQSLINKKMKVDGRVLKLLDTMSA